MLAVHDEVDGDLATVGSASRTVYVLTTGRCSSGSSLKLSRVSGCGSASTSTSSRTMTNLTYESVNSLGLKVSKPVPPSTNRIMCGVSCSLLIT